MEPDGFEHADDEQKQPEECEANPDRSDDGPDDQGGTAPCRDESGDFEEPAERPDAVRALWVQGQLDGTRTREDIGGTQRPEDCIKRRPCGALPLWDFGSHG